MSPYEEFPLKTRVKNIYTGKNGYVVSKENTGLGVVYFIRYTDLSEGIALWSDLSEILLQPHPLSQPL